MGKGRVGSAVPASVEDGEVGQEPALFPGDSDILRIFEGLLVGWEGQHLRRWLLGPSMPGRRSAAHAHFPISPGP
jgi:hypothetical protein